MKKNNGKYENMNKVLELLKDGDYMNIVEISCKIGVPRTTLYNTLERMCVFNSLKKINGEYALIDA